MVEDGVRSVMDYVCICTRRTSKRNGAAHAVVCGQLLHIGMAIDMEKCLRGLLETTTRVALGCRTGSPANVDIHLPMTSAITL